MQRQARKPRPCPGVPYSLTAKSFTFSNGVTFTPAQFEAWNATETPKYLAACQAARDAQAAKDAEARAAWELQQKRDKKNAEIQAARDRLAALEAACDQHARNWEGRKQPLIAASVKYPNL